MATLTGRPSDFTDVIAQRICDGVSEGKSLREICEADDMPGRSTVFRWLEANSIFRDQYARAKAFLADMDADDIVDIADGKVPVAADGEDVEGPAKDPARDRLRVDARKWRASKLAPKKYGDKLAHVGGGADDDPIRHALDLSKLAEDELDALEGLVTKAGRTIAAEPTEA
jgi:hypothetical protein